MTIRPSLLLDFANAGMVADGRYSFVRASVGSYFDATGVLRYAPANTPRIQYDPATGVCRGLLMESTRTNLALASESFDSASWTKTGLTVTANTSAAPDGATTMDTLAATASGGNVRQSVTIAAGNGIALSFYAQAGASGYAWAQISDGSVSVSAWFNLVTGAVGSSSAGSGQVTFSSKFQRAAGGIYRCGLVVSTSTATSFTVSISAAGADGAAPATGNAIAAWGVQVESPGAVATCSVSSYIPTTTATATRSVDYGEMAVPAPWFDPIEGTLVIEASDVDRAGGVMGGIANTFAESMYLWRPNLTSVQAIVGSGSVEQAALGIPVDWSAIVRSALAYKRDSFAHSVNGAAPLVDSAGTLPLSPARLTVGCDPWTPTGQSVAFDGVIRRLAYYPRRLGNAALSALTA